MTPAVHVAVTFPSPVRFLQRSLETVTEERDPGRCLLKRRALGIVLRSLGVAVSLMDTRRQRRRMSAEGGTMRDGARPGGMVLTVPACGACLWDVTAPLPLAPRPSHRQTGSEHIACVGSAVAAGSPVLCPLPEEWPQALLLTALPVQPRSRSASQGCDFREHGRVF